MMLHFSSKVNAVGNETVVETCSTPSPSTQSLGASVGVHKPPKKSVKKQAHLAAVWKDGMYGGFKRCSQDRRASAAKCESASDAACRRRGSATKAFCSFGVRA